VKPTFETTWEDERGRSVTHTGTAAGTEKILKRFAKAGILATTIQVGVPPERQSDFPSGVFMGKDGKVYWALQSILPRRVREGRVP